MEVLTKDKSDSPVLLSNSEVMEMLKTRIKERKEKESKQKRRTKQSKKYKHRDWIEEQVFEYLEKTPCMKVDASKRNAFKSTLMSTKKSRANGEAKRVTGFGLTEAESMQILNFMPKERVEIHLMVEELHARMSETRQDELLELIQSHREEVQDVVGKDGTKNKRSRAKKSVDQNEFSIKEDEI